MLKILIIVNVKKLFRFSNLVNLVKLYKKGFFKKKTIKIVGVLLNIIENI